MESIALILFDASYPSLKCEFCFKTILNNLKDAKPFIIPNLSGLKRCKRNNNFNLSKQGQDKFLQFKHLRIEKFYGKLHSCFIYFNN